LYVYCFLSFFLSFSQKAIMLSVIKMTNSEIRQGIIKMEEALFTEQMLHNFLEFLPTAEEV